MEVSYIQLMKIDHDNNCVTVESFEGQDNIKKVVFHRVCLRRVHSSL